MLRLLSTVLILLFICANSFAYDMAALESETAEDLLLFFEEEELVIATRRPTSVRKAPAIATVITSREIKNMGARNLKDILKLVPGLGISINEFGAPMFEVRGIRTNLSEKVLLMVDGHSLNKNMVGSALFHLYSNLSVENIKQVEIVRGPGSALFGANAFTAVINIVTKEADEIDGLLVTAKGGSFDSEQYNLLAGKSVTTDLKIAGYVDYYNTDGPNTRIEADSLSGTPWTNAPGNADLFEEKNDIFLKLTYKDLYIKGHYLKKRTGNYISTTYTLTDEEHWPKYYYWLEAGYNLDINDQLSANMKVYYDYYEQKAVVKLMPEGFAGSFPNGMIGEPQLKDRTIGGELQLSYDISAQNHLVFGVAYEKITQFDVKVSANFDPTLFPPTPAYLGSVQDVSSWANWNKDVTREILAIYIQDEWEIINNLNLTAGIRHDHYSDFGDTTNPRVGIVWDFMENANLKMLYGQAFRAPNFIELYNRNNPVNVGNPDLNPERIKTYEAGLGITLTQSLKANINYFYSDIEDLIIWDTSTSPALHVNEGKAEVDGIELVFTGQYTPNNYWKLAYTYQDPKDPDTNQRLAYVPLHRATASINYGLTKYLNIHTDILWTGERSRPSGDTREPAADYTTVDLALTMKNVYKSLEIQGTIHNLFNEKYEDPDRSGAAQLVPNDYPREGISAMLNVSYKFF